MRSVQLRAEDPHTGVVIGWRNGVKMEATRDKATNYSTTGSLQTGIESAERAWPQYRWRFFYWRSEQEFLYKRQPKKLFTREEVLKLIEAEREGCALLCDDEGQIRSEAGKKHPEDSRERGRCFAGARAAVNCALAIRSERPKPASLLP